MPDLLVLGCLPNAKRRYLLTAALETRISINLWHVVLPIFLCHKTYLPKVFLAFAFDVPVKSAELFVEVGTSHYRQQDSL